MKYLIQIILKKLGYTLKKIKYFYNSDVNLIKTINHFKIKNIIDVGANRGQFAEKIFNSNFKGNIVSFEPLIEEHQIIQSKIIKTSKTNWFLEERCALGEKSTKTTMYVSVNSESSSLLKIQKKHTEIRPLSKTKKKIQVNVKKLDFFFFNLNRFLNKKTLLKIDTQGSELSVLKGATKILKKVDFVLVEVSIIPLYENQNLWSEVLSFLKNKNFKVWSIDRVMGNHMTGQTYQLDIFLYKTNK